MIFLEVKQIQILHKTYHEIFQACDINHAEVNGIHYFRSNSNQSMPVGYKSTNFLADQLTSA
jgi:hypothetical protein